MKLTIDKLYKICYNNDIMESKENKTEVIHIRVTKRQKELLEKDASDRDIDVSKLVRVLLELD